MKYNAVPGRGQLFTASVCLMVFIASPARALVGEDAPLPTKADFDGSGPADLAIAAPYENIGDVRDAGAVSVMYGSSSGFSPPGDLWSQENLFGSSPEDYDEVGGAMVAGDFDGDGFSDLAIGAPGESWHDDQYAGVVHVVYGSAGEGLSVSKQDCWHQNQGDLEGEVDPGDWFGHALAAGDFDGDGYDDLAVGVPREDVFPFEDAGSVQIIYGSSEGLASEGNQLWEQNNAEAFDEFGAVLAAGDLDGDGYDDLAIGTPRESIGEAHQAGVVEILYGGALGLYARATNDFWNQDRSGIHDDIEDLDQFGRALAIADFDSDGFDDLVIGVPFEDLNGFADEDAGVAHVLFGSPTGPTATGTILLYQGSTHVGNSINGGDQFARALTTADFDNDGHDDLAIGVPGEDWGAADNCGFIHVLFGDEAGFRTSSMTLHQAWLSTEGDNEEGDKFGTALAAADFNGDRFDDLAVGAPGEDHSGVTDAGMVFILYGSPVGPWINNDVVAQGRDGCADAAEAADNFGLVMAAVPMRNGKIFTDGFESGDISGWSTTVP